MFFDRPFGKPFEKDTVLVSPLSRAAFHFLSTQFNLFYRSEKRALVNSSNIHFLKQHKLPSQKAEIDEIPASQTPEYPHLKAIENFNRFGILFPEEFPIPVPRFRTSTIDIVFGNPSLPASPPIPDSFIKQYFSTFPERGDVFRKKMISEKVQQDSITKGAAVLSATLLLASGGNLPATVLGLALGLPVLSIVPSRLTSLALDTPPRNVVKEASANAYHHFFISQQFKEFDEQKVHQSEEL